MTGSRICVVFALLFGAPMSGCTIRPSDTAKASSAVAIPAPGAPSTTPANVVSVEVEERPGPSALTEKKKGIQVVAVSAIGIRAGNPNGAPVTGRIRAEHLCAGDAIEAFSYASPLRGTIKGHGYGQVGGTGQLRYYPPAYPCEDQIEVKLMAPDGCSATASLPIRVGSPSRAPLASGELRSAAATPEDPIGTSAADRLARHPSAVRALFQDSTTAIDSWDGEIQVGAEALSAAGYVARLSDPLTITLLDPHGRARSTVTHGSDPPKAVCWVGKSLLVLYHKSPNRNILLVYDADRRMALREFILIGPFYHGMRARGGETALLLCQSPTDHGAVVNLRTGQRRAGPLSVLPLPV